jgi:hypothetical protein
MYLLVCSTTSIVSLAGFRVLFDFVGARGVFSSINETFSLLSIERLHKYAIWTSKGTDGTVGSDVRRHWGWRLQCAWLEGGMDSHAIRRAQGVCGGDTRLFAPQRACYGGRKSMVELGARVALVAPHEPL